MKTYLETLVSEKGLDAEMLLEVEGKSGLNIIPLQIVIDAISEASKAEQKAIKAMLVKIDFVNGSVADYFKHLAQAIAI
tara:strand:+ start:21238 stop:21474 length:237 start_codon:yes stop_codon:yes gene_type:complete